MGAACSCNAIGGRKMTNPYSKENPGNFANDRERARKAGKKGGETTSKRYLEEARKSNQGEQSK